tara:strand:+ start:483 stop:680 length:198 start_codon:yes stop_codon:yes gene_type:complete
MSKDLNYTEKFVLQVERLKRSDIKTAEFDVHFLSKVAKEMGEYFDNEYKEKAEQSSSSVDGGSFK